MTEPLAFVLPELRPDSASHYSHYVRLVQEVATLTRVALVVERADLSDEAALAALLPGVEVRLQRETTPVRRARELAGIMRALSGRGYRHAYGSYSPFFGVAGSLTARALGMRTSYWHCRSDFFDAGISQRLTLRRALSTTLPMVLSLHLSHRVVTGTPGLAERYRQTFGLPRRKLRVVPNDIDIDAFAAPERATRDPLTVLFVGRLGEHQGARMLPKIVSEVLRAVPQVRFVIAGGGPDELRIAAELDPRSVEMLGYVPNSQIAALLHAATVLVMPSLTEGFPRRLLEAMAAELPFVTTDAGGIPEVVPPEVEVTPSGDASAVAAATVALLEDPARRSRLAAAGRRHVEQFSVDLVAPAFLRAVT